MAEKQTYVVKVDFTDEKGKRWTVGSKFEGDENAVQGALKRGQVVASPTAPPGHSGTPPGHGGTPPGQGGTPPGQTNKPQTPPGQELPGEAEPKE